jgi:hypothetical protein
VVEKIFFAPNIMVEAALPDSETPTNLSHGSGSITIFIEQKGGDPIQFDFPQADDSLRHGLSSSRHRL